MGALDRAIDAWQEVIDRFLAGKLPLGALRAPFDEWFNSYRGRRDGTVEPRAFPEPYLGPLDRRPRMAFLALNPGNPDPLQFLGGEFANQIAATSYRHWAASWPYLRAGDAWVASHGTNRHHQARLSFMRRWYDDSDLTEQHMVTFELYPWHSKVWHGAKVRPGLLREYVFDVIAELAPPAVFAFGKDWVQMLTDHPHELGLTLRGELPPGYFRVPSRRAVIAQMDNTIVVASMHNNYAAPPAQDDVVLMREGLAQELGWSRPR